MSNSPTGGQEAQEKGILMWLVAPEGGAQGLHCLAQPTCC